MPDPKLDAALTAVVSGVKALQIDRDKLAAENVKLKAQIAAQPPVPPPIPPAPLPTQAKLYIDERFLGGKVNSKFLQFNFDPYHYAIQSPFIQDNNEWVGHYYALQQTNERSPWQLYIDSAAVAAATGKETFDECCLEWSEKFLSNYPWPTSGQKLLRIGYDRGPTPESKKEWTFASLNSNTNVQASWYQGYWGDETYGVIDDAINSGKAHPIDSWTTWRVWIKLNTPGLSDGFVKIERNTSPFFTKTDLNMRGRDVRGYNYLWLGGNYSQLPESGPLKSSGSRYIKNVKFWNTRP